jgi:hypothetical protein
MNKEKTIRRMQEMTNEELEWIESQVKSVRSERAKQKTRNYTLHEPRKMEPRKVKPRPTENFDLQGSDSTRIGFASLHTFFQDSYAKHHPGHCYEEDRWEDM